ncbi:salivary acidic proline-rich phosphoprotein 1/2-like [Marmota flaviventris]|uniref:salivary acidic proline-rich phosphoprotein 1/2-like n=1 Tax=Marmota flaviventris TaxID=93162 RepID=UPI003A866AF0
MNGKGPYSGSSLVLRVTQQLQFSSVGLSSTAEFQDKMSPNSDKQSQIYQQQPQRYQNGEFRPRPPAGYRNQQEGSQQGPPQQGGQQQQLNGPPRPGNHQRPPQQGGQQHQPDGPPCPGNQQGPSNKEVSSNSSSSSQMPPFVLEPSRDHPNKEVSSNSSSSSNQMPPPSW